MPGWYLGRPPGRGGMRGLFLSCCPKLCGLGKFPGLCGLDSHVSVLPHWVPHSLGLDSVWHLWLLQVCRTLSGPLLPVGRTHSLLVEPQ
jgi:hypothetical protein